MAIDYQLFGKRVLQLRKEKGWSQERLAEKSGISNNYVSNIEKLLLHSQFGNTDETL